MTARVAAWYNAVVDFRIETLFIRKKEPGPRRTVWVNQDLPQDYYFDASKKRKQGTIKPEHTYQTNQVITSKYTVITFIPRNLLEQFRRVANVFFLGINILQFFPKFSTISPGLVIFPLLLVLAITAFKDGYEDIKRHQSDRRVNNAKIRVLSGGEFSNRNVMKPKSRTFVRGLAPKTIQSKIRQRRGDPEKTVLDAQKQQEPPDIEFDHEDHDNDGTNTPPHHFWQGEHETTKPHWKKTAWEELRVGDFVKILDNEPVPADILICATSEEENVAFVETKNLDGETNLKSRNAVPTLVHLRSSGDCANPANAFSVECNRPDNNMFKLNSTVNVKGGEKKYPADMTMTLLRGTVLRNTGWVIGVVLFTGEDTKIILNSGGTPSKRGRVERAMNPQVLLNLLLLAMMAIACAIVDSINEHRDFPSGAPWLIGDDTSGDNPSINGLVTWAYALITFQNIVPISLYISIEFVRTAQAAFIYFDSEIWYAKTDTPTLARSWNLSDDLGQIEYIFSDKTGTLTQNKMVFRHCSIGGKAYLGEQPPESEEVKGKERKGKAGGTPETDASTSQGDTSPTREGSVEGGEPSSSSTNETHHTSNDDDDTHYYSSQLVQDISQSLQADSHSSSASHARTLNGFFTVLSLCHTVLTTVDHKTGKVSYKAQSPDEGALVKAAADCGYQFMGRDREVLFLRKPSSSPSPPSPSGEVEKDGDRDDRETERYELLNILEFSSSRKRMSVVVRRLDSDDGRVFLLTKGADNVIFERLKPGTDESIRELTEMHLSEFANEGLRTLTLAYKMVPEDDHRAWSERYHQATVSVEDRESKIEAVCEELERDLRLLGATAIEDSLQDGVPETIADLKRAGIKIWVATGDKLETAIAIGHSTNLVSKDSNLIVVRGGTAMPVFQQMAKAVQDFFPESGILDEQGVLKHPTRPQISSSHSRYSSETRPSSTRLRRVETETGISSIVGTGNGDRPGGFILVIDGTALSDALNERNKDLLLRLAMLCEGVICCRVSPLQKALIVKLVKDGIHAMTLAIGDGANDVSMIQAADVGVGISGEEGLQAANASDYAIAQFRFLKRLLLVHGHWCYARNSNMILNFFYKNIICIGVLWWFQIFDAWSSTYVFEYTYLIFWNSFWTIAPVIAIGLFDRVADAVVLMAIPELYRYGREGTWFSMKLFCLYVLDATYQSAIVFFLTLYTYKTTTTRLDGYGVYQYEFSTTMVIAAVFCANLFNGLNTNVWTKWVFFAVSVGIVLVWAYTAIYSLIAPGWFYTPVYGNDLFLFHSAAFWFTLPITIFLALLPRYAAKAWKFGFAPNDIDVLRWFRKEQPDADLSSYYNDGRLNNLRNNPAAASDALSRQTSRSTVGSEAPAPLQRPATRVHPTASCSQTDMATGIRSVHRGFNFATEEGGVAMRRMQSSLSEVRRENQRPSGFRERRRKLSEGVGSVFSKLKKS